MNKEDREDNWLLHLGEYLMQFGGGSVKEKIKRDFELEDIFDDN